MELRTIGKVEVVSFNQNPKDYTLKFTYRENGKLSGTNCIGSWTTIDEANAVGKKVAEGFGCEFVPYSKENDK
jgi:hypothetical protein